MKRLFAALFTCALFGAAGWIVTHRPQQVPATQTPVSFSNRINVEVQPSGSAR